MKAKNKSWVPRLSWDDFLRVLSASNITHQQDQYSNLLILIFGIQSSPVTRRAASFLLSKQQVKFTPNQIIKLVKSNLNLRSDVMGLFLDQMEKDQHYSARSSILEKIRSKFSRGIFNDIRNILFEAIAYGCIGAVYAIVERYPNALKMKNKNGEKPYSCHITGISMSNFHGESFLQYMLEREPNMNPILLRHIANGYMKALTKCQPKTGLYPFAQPAIRRRSDRKSSIDSLTNIYELIRKNPTSVTPHIQEKGINEQSEHQSVLSPTRLKDMMRIVLVGAGILTFFLIAVMIRMYSVQHFDHFQR
ncbi:predicted protein [Chaetoceros tenuissimus]|uniref:Uncharacterized protein n=1 Tax=Chaetoceros tenuissimus TaxID=426638 RepID=A0AAD3GZG2_9STRA|nr:predicted protein [Chaetoceros tenuissimus]